MRDIVLIAHNIRSTHNVGSLLRTSDGLGIKEVYLTGYTPYPATSDDPRLPHLAAKIDKQIDKTALGAQKSLSWSRSEEIKPVLEELRKRGYKIAALEQSPGSVLIKDFRAPQKLVLILGREVEGIEPELLATVDTILELPMRGSKESFNVAVAGAMALYHLTYLS